MTGPQRLTATALVLDALLIMLAWLVWVPLPVVTGVCGLGAVSWAVTWGER